MDFILTDLLPVEISELFSFSQFYLFLMEKKQREVIEQIINTLRIHKSKGDKVMFEHGWGAQPLKFNILKTKKTLREMSIVHPFSAINLFLFMECYQKDLLNYFENNHYFSIRYHKKNTDLYYKSKSKQATNYFQAASNKIGKGAIQQAGNYFKIFPFESINSFTDSRKWRISNFKFKNYAKADFKSCFDSIYTHAFKWIIVRHVVDSKMANNSHLFITIDRILQNINGLSSNGLIVGPEFSRLTAEVLLQQIDHEVKSMLLVENIAQHTNYEIFRYVDDIHIFAHDKETVDKIIENYTHIGDKYLLKLNELKLFTCQTPCLPKEWLGKTRAISDVISGFFYRGKKTQFEKLPEDEQFIVSAEHISVDRIKDEILVLIKQNDEDTRTIVSFLLSTIINNISKKKDGYRLFGKNAIQKAMTLIDTSLFIYAFYPAFEQTRKIISIISYMNKEINFKENLDARSRLSGVINHYNFIFQTGNLFDICDWFPFFREYQIYLNSKTEDSIAAKALKMSNPILLANILLYSQYHKPFFEKTKTDIESLIEKQINQIVPNEYFLQREFWFILIFHNCPLISDSLKNKLDQIIVDTAAKAASKGLSNMRSSELVTMMVCDFLQIQLANGKKPEYSFFNWKGVKEFSEKITFRTYQRTVFKKYRKNSFRLYASIE